MGYEQFVCEACELITSRRRGSCKHAEEAVCEGCAGRLVAWEGRIWLEPTEDIGLLERSTDGARAAGTGSPSKTEVSAWSSGTRNSAHVFLALLADFRVLVQKRVRFAAK
jgi:hypothetical protein